MTCRGRMTWQGRRGCRERGKTTPTTAAQRRADGEPDGSLSMTTSTSDSWPEEFGISGDDAKLFFATRAEFGAREASTAQAHVLRRAFELLNLDGVFCAENTPLVYFKKVDPHRTDIAALHRKFWNHGGAPVLVLIGRDEVQIYSGLIRPEPQTTQIGDISALVERLDRASSAIREVLPAVESGEYFRRHARSFDPAHRVDRDLLDNLEATRDEVLSTAMPILDSRVLDALICRLVFACYLFDRGVIGESYLDAAGIRGARHLRDVLSIQPRTKAKESLYGLFCRLGQDFNGDLFSTDLNAEARSVSASSIATLNGFFNGTNAVTGQRSFWPYDFSAIPVEVVSAIYERFLHTAKKRDGAFYTPRFLAEAVLDIALAATPSLLGRRYLDPACGSGIFLVGLFNRMAEEWRRENPTVRNDRRARELRKILCDNLAGVDVNSTACRITAFSLYLAYLDQLSPRDIHELQLKGHKLPRLVHYADDEVSVVEGNIWCGDFFARGAPYPVDVDFVIGNPPWGSTATSDTPAAKWARDGDHAYPIADKQLAAAFMWKATHHINDSGRICLVLPHAMIFNHSTTALEFQRAFFGRQAVDIIVNLVDYRFFLFSEATAPAIVVRYRKGPPSDVQDVIQYWAPKSDWLVMRGEIISIAPEDRSSVTIGEVLADLETKDAPQVWKQRFWASARDRRLLDRLRLFSRLRDHIRQLREVAPNKPWTIAVGLQPVRDNDDPQRAKDVRLPSRLFIEAQNSSALALFLLKDDCRQLPTASFTVRSGSNIDTTVFRAPHVLVAKGFTAAAFADFDVSFQDFLRGIHGPSADRELLIFLAAYLNSTLAKYFLFHTSSNWAITRQQIHVDELLRLPFPLPSELPDESRGREIVSQIVRLVTAATAGASGVFVDRAQVVDEALSSIEPLINEYFDLVPEEHTLVRDTLQVIVPSFHPRLGRRVIPTIEPSTESQRTTYAGRLCDTLNAWTTAKGIVTGNVTTWATIGIGVVVLQKLRPGDNGSVPAGAIAIAAALQRVRAAVAGRLNTLDIARGVKVFDGDRLYIVKPLARRFWTETAALNDADEIAGSVLMYTAQGNA